MIRAAGDEERDECFEERLPKESLPRTTTKTTMLVKTSFKEPSVSTAAHHQAEFHLSCELLSGFCWSSFSKTSPHGSDFWFC